MKHHVLRILLAVFAFVVTGGLVHYEFKRNSEEKAQTVSFQVGEEVIGTWEDEGVHYLFLPSYADMDAVELMPYSPAFEIPSLGITVSGNTGLKGLPLKQELDCVLNDSGEAFRLYIMQSEHLPAVFIETATGSLERIRENKEYRETGGLVVINADGKQEIDIALKAIGGRGNTSFAGYEKKPYSLTLSKEASLLGLPAGEKYALISNASDPSLIRNDLTRQMEETMGIAYSHSGRFVDLYINEEYQGNYYLCDTIEIGAERINITDMETPMELVYQQSNVEAVETYETPYCKGKIFETNLSDITGGYLLEREYAERFEHEYEQMGSGFVTEGEEHFVVKSPAYCSKEQIEYIYSYVNEAEKAILSKDGINPDTKKSYREYIDTDGFVKKYLTEEISKNYDGGVTSSYFYKDSEANGGKLCPGPGWDYDMSWGNYVEWMEYFSADPEGISKLDFHTYATAWYVSLYEKEEYLSLVKRYYKEKAEPFLEELLNEKIQWYETHLEVSAAMNEIRWRKELAQNPYYTTREECFGELRAFIEDRKEYLDGQWLLGETR